MLNALKALFETIITFCMALNKFGNAANHIGDYVEGGAKSLADKARVEREAELNKLKATNITTPALTAPTE